MFIFNESDLTSYICSCKSTEHYLIDDVYMEIISLTDAKKRNIDIINYKTIKLHELAINYAKRFSILRNDEKSLNVLLSNKFEDFYSYINGNDKIISDFFNFLTMDRTICYDFCKENNLRTLISSDFLFFYLNKKTSFEIMLKHIDKLLSLFTAEDIKLDTDLANSEGISIILKELFSKQFFKEYRFLFQLSFNDMFFSEGLRDELFSYYKVSNFELRRAYLLNPKNKNKREYILYIFSFDKVILNMINSEFHNYTRILKFEATDNPYGYAFGMEIRPEKTKCLGDLITFINKYSDVFNRMRNRTDKPLKISINIVTNYFPQNGIDDLDISPDELKMLGNLGIGISAINQIGE